MNQRVLILDDDSERTVLMQGALDAAGYDVVVVRAESYGELQAQIHRFQPSVIVLDDELIINVDGREPVLADLAA